MATDILLGSFEEQVLVALAHDGDDAYGMRVRRELERRTGRDVAIGAVYATLDRLEAKGLVESFRREAEPDSGRGRRFFRMTAAGARALLGAAEQRQRLWQDLDLASLSRAAERSS